MQPIVTDYQYVGDIAALGSLQMTMLAKGFEEVDYQSLDFLFPDVVINEREIVIERVIEGLRIAPLVRPGVPSGAFLDSPRIERRRESPAYVREDDFLDQYVINQMKAPGSFNEQMPAMQLIASRTKRLVNSITRTKDLLRAFCLQGSISYEDPRTRVGINVDTHIPAHNMFKYDGYLDTVAANGIVQAGGYNFTAAKALINDKNRPEALLFANAEGQFGVPWTNRTCDIVRCLRLLLQYLWSTNKNRFTDIIMSRDLYTVLLDNSYFRAYAGTIGVFQDPFNGTANTNNTPFSSGANAMVQFGPGGDITSIAGLKITLLDTMYRDPVDGEIKKMWESNIVALVARNHVTDPSATLGFTHNCVGESPDGTAGLWSRVGPDVQPPGVPGRAMQMGNAFLPFATYPHWISLLKVCETEEVDQNVFLRSDLNYGTF